MSEYMDKTEAFEGEARCKTVKRTGFRRKCNQRASLKKDWIFKKYAYIVGPRAS